MKLAIWVLLVHVLVDFVFQTPSIATDKANIKLRGFVYHIGIYALCLLPFFMLLGWQTFGLLLLGHLVIDLTKSGLSALKGVRQSPELRLIIFIGDQVAHLALMYGLVNTIIIGSFVQIGSSLYSVLGMQLVVTYISITLYIVLSGRWIVPMVFDIVYKKVPDYNDQLDQLMSQTQSKHHAQLDSQSNTGKWIGMIERLLMVVFLFVGSFEAIGFVIAVKSLARFKQMDQKIFAEYYIMGTFVSLAYTLIAFYTLVMYVSL